MAISDTYGYLIPSTGFIIIFPTVGITGAVELLHPPWMQVHWHTANIAQKTAFRTLGAMVIDTIDLALSNLSGDIPLIYLRIKMIRSLFMYDAWEVPASMWNQYLKMWKLQIQSSRHLFRGTFPVFFEQSL